MASNKGKRKSEIFLLSGLMLTLALAGCSLPRPPTPAIGVTLLPGRYLSSYFQASGFKPAAVSFHLNSFLLQETSGVDAGTFLPLFHAELAQTWEANGLKVSDDEIACRLSGVIQHVGISGGALRFFLGRLSAHLEITGTITQGDRIVVAFQDRLSLSSPVNPGPPALKEADLLLRQLCREFACHLLNELLLPGEPKDSG